MDTKKVGLLVSLQKRYQKTANFGKMAKTIPKKADFWYRRDFILSTRIKESQSFAKKSDKLPDFYYNGKVEKKS